MEPTLDSPEWLPAWCLFASQRFHRSFVVLEENVGCGWQKRELSRVGMVVASNHGNHGCPSHRLLHTLPTPTDRDRGVYYIHGPIAASRFSRACLALSLARIPVAAGVGHLGLGTIFQAKMIPIQQISYPCSRKVHVFLRGLTYLLRDKWFIPEAY